MKKVGIILLNYNGSDLLKLTLDSLVRTENDIQWEVVVVDNGSESDDCQRAEDFYNEIITSDSNKGCFIKENNNKGFAGGCNIGLNYFLEDSSITHLCLLNSDVIVTHHWLDILASDGLEVAGPVTNAALSEQKIAVDIEPQRDETAFVHVNAFAMKRQSAYGGYRTGSDMLVFFATVFTRKVIETVGLLDERFFPGLYEDDDYCIRVINAGYKIHVLRDCYIHHWGSASFTHYSEGDFFDIWRTSLNRFEVKWGIKWHDHNWKLIKSCVQDSEFLAKNEQSTSWAADMLAKGYVEHFRFLREVNPALKARFDIELPFRENVRQVIKKIKRRCSPSLRNENPAIAKRLEEKSIKERAEKVEAQIMEYIRRNTKKAICVFAPIFTEENISDGYMQRVKAVDEEVLDGFNRVYLDTEKPRVAPEIKIVDEKHISVLLDPEDPGQEKIIQNIIRHCGTVYIHSVMRVMKNVFPEKLRDNLLAKNNKTVIWDVHGAVPEEYALNNDYFEAQLAGDAEDFLARQAKMLVAVNHAMKRHLEKKYGSKMSAQLSVMPIFNSDLKNIIDCSQEKTLKEGQPPLAVYAGGLQKWQNIARMQDYIIQAGDVCRYAVFVPRVDEFLALWGERGRPDDMRVEHKQPMELIEEYKSCHYGFVLRDDIVVNNVACPTKIIEYIQYGIIPVMDTPNIGDFTDLGMKYIEGGAFSRGELPGESERRQMAEVNYQVLKKLVEAYLDGKESVLRFLS